MKASKRPKSASPSIKLDLQFIRSFASGIHRPGMNRKTIIIGAVVVVVLVIVIAVPCALLLGKKDEDKPKEKSYAERAVEILDETPLVDG